MLFEFNLYICNRTTTNKMKLGQLVRINSGIFTSNIKHGDVYYLQARDFDANRQISSNLTPTLSYSENLEKHFLQPDDVLVVAKGASFLSAIFDGSYSPAVASTVFMVIRPINRNIVLPEYLSWHINLISTQNELFSKSIGTSTPSINKKILEDLEIPVPEIMKQNLILKIAELRKNEMKLRRKIEELKENKLNQLISNAINN